MREAPSFTTCAPGAGEPMLLIQGMSATHMTWGRPFLAPLEESFDCIVFDNRGMGLLRAGGAARSRSPTSPATRSALLDALEIERAHVVGISMGGMIAQELALAHPERIRSLTLGATYCGGPEGHPDGARGPEDARRGDGLRGARAGLPRDVGDQPLPRLPRGRRRASPSSARWQPRCRPRGR